MCAASLLSCDAAHVFVEISYLPVSSVSIHVCGRLLVFPSLVLRVRSSTKCHSLPLQERFSSPLFFVWLHFLWFEPRTLAISITTNGGSMGTGGTPIPPAILVTTERITISISTRISGLAVIPLLRADSTGILRQASLSAHRHSELQLEDGYRSAGRSCSGARPSTLVRLSLPA